MPFRLSRSERINLVATLEALQPDQELVYHNIHVSVIRGKWWTQSVANGNCGYPQISKTPELAVRKIVRLLGRRQQNDPASGEPSELASG